jgi:MFS family permease
VELSKKLFFLRHPYLLLFSVIQIVFSAPGQTFLIALFVPNILQSIDITRTEFALLYSVATILASLLLNPAGRLIDKRHLNHIVIFNGLCMALGCVFLWASSSLFFLFISFFLLRLFGQGIFGLTASTTLGKAFGKNRAKAIGIMTLGFPLSEMIYPSVTMGLIMIFGWRETYLIFAASFLLLMVPLQLFVLSKSHYNDGEFLEGEYSDSYFQSKEKNISLTQAVRQPQFFLLIIASCIPPIIMTGLFFHQDKLFEVHHWPQEWLGIGITCYAVAKALGSILLGPYIDKNGPVLMFVIMILLLSLGTFIAGLGGGTTIICVFFSFMGFALGLSSPVMNVVWPSLYGTQHLGSIKGFVGMFRNGLTAFGPLPPAIAMDMGVSLTNIFFIAALGAACTACIPIFVLRQKY